MTMTRNEVLEVSLEVFEDVEARNVMSASLLRLLIDETQKKLDPPDEESKVIQDPDFTVDDDDLL